MKGSVGFLVGAIGMCFFAAVAILIPMTMRQSDGMFLFLLLLAVAFVFLNVLIVGLYRILVHLHDTVLFPDDPYFHTQRGKPLFFIGYLGVVVMLVFVALLAFMEGVMRIHLGRQMETLLAFIWFLGWIFFGLFLSGILAMLSDVYHKAFYRSTMPSPDADTDEDFNIARGGSRRPHRPSERREERHQPWPEE